MWLDSVCFVIYSVVQWYKLNTIHITKTSEKFCFHACFLKHMRIIRVGLNFIHLVVNLSGVWKCYACLKISFPKPSHGAQAWRYLCKQTVLICSGCFHIKSSCSDFLASHGLVSISPCDFCSTNIKKVNLKRLMWKNSQWSFKRDATISRYTFLIRLLRYYNWCLNFER